MTAAVGHQIQDARRQRRMSVDELAKACDLAAGTIRAFEQGRRNPSLQSIKRMEEALEAEFDISRDTYAPFQGGHPRHTEQAVTDDNVLRLKVIDRVLKMDIDTLAALYSLIEA